MIMIRNAALVLMLFLSGSLFTYGQTGRNEFSWASTRYDTLCKPKTFTGYESYDVAIAGSRVFALYNLIEPSKKSCEDKISFNLEDIKSCQYKESGDHFVLTFISDSRDAIKHMFAGNCATYNGAPGNFCSLSFDIKSKDTVLGILKEQGVVVE
jgi:hypothetical protein